MNWSIARDLVPAMAAIGLITLGYVALAQQGLPRPGGWVGHSLGVAGLALMLWAQLGYTARKRLRRFRRGSMRFWLAVHIFAGIVGAYLALLHTAGRFQGLAGALAAITVLIIVSGLVGRFIYTAVPRTLEGAEVGAPELLAQCAEAERELTALGVPAADPILAVEPPYPGWLLIFGRRGIRRLCRRQFHLAVGRLPEACQPESQRILRLLEARYALRLEVRSLATARRVLSWWHVLHVPLGVVLFLLAAIHIGAAVYYSTLLR